MCFNLEKIKLCICFKRYVFWYEEKIVDVCIRYYVYWFRGKKVWMCLKLYYVVWFREKKGRVEFRSYIFDLEKEGSNLF